MMKNTTFFTFSIISFSTAVHIKENITIIHINYHIFSIQRIKRHLNLICKHLQGIFINVLISIRSSTLVSSTHFDSDKTFIIFSLVIFMFSIYTQMCWKYQKKISSPPRRPLVPSVAFSPLLSFVDDGH